MSVRFAGVLLVIVLAVACGTDPTDTPTPPPPDPTATALPPQATNTPVLATATVPPTPAATPNPPPTQPPTPSATRRPATATRAPTPALAWPRPAPPPMSSVEELAALWSLLPAGAQFLAFVEVAVVAPKEDSMIWYMEDDLAILRKRTDGVLSEEMLSNAGIERAVFGGAANTGGAGAGVLQGDFSGFVEALRQAPELSDGIRDFDPPSILPAHRNVEVFLFPYYDDLYIAVPDTRTLLLSQDAGLLEEIIDRRLDGGELDESLRGLLDAIGPVDFLVTRRFGPQAMGQDAFPHFLAGGGRADAEETSTMFWYMEFADSEEAAQRMERLKDRRLVQGYNTGEHHPIREITQEGRVVISRGYVHNNDLQGALLGN